MMSVLIRVKTIVLRSMLTRENFTCSAASSAILSISVISLQSFRVVVCQRLKLADEGVCEHQQQSDNE